MLLTSAPERPPACILNSRATPVAGSCRLHPHGAWHDHASARDLAVKILNSFRCTCTASQPLSQMHFSPPPMDSDFGMHAACRSPNYGRRAIGQLSMHCTIVVYILGSWLVPMPPHNHPIPINSCSMHLVHPNLMLIIIVIKWRVCCWCTCCHVRSLYP